MKNIPSRTVDKNEDIDALKLLSLYVKERALKTIVNANSGHVGATLSSLEMMLALYLGGVMRFDPSDPHHPLRDRVFVRGHVGPLRYNIFSLFGWCNEEDVVNSYRKLGSPFQGHESMFEVPGVDITPSGSLGMGLSYGVGVSYVMKKYGKNSRSFVFLGDGEEQEGNVSEAARHASHLNLDNLVGIIDRNGKQLGNTTSNLDGSMNLAQIWNGYGWNVFEMENGHDFHQVLEQFHKIESLAKSSKPTLFIVNTIKGNSIPGAEEHASGYHTLSTCKPEIIESTLAGLQKHLLTYDDLSNLVKKTVEGLIHRNVVIPEGVDIVDMPIGTFQIESPFENDNLNSAIDVVIKEIIGKFKQANSPGLYFGTADWLSSKDISLLGMDSPHVNLINPGIKEQHLFAMAHGISLTDKNSRIILIEGDTFILRALDQLSASAQASVPMIILGTTAGISASKNGSTHQSVSVPGIILQTPGIDMFEPSDPEDLRMIMQDAFTHYDKPKYIRLHNTNVINFERLSPKPVSRNTDQYVCYEPKNLPQVMIVGAGLVLDAAVKLAHEKDSSGFGMRVINIVNMKTVGESFVKMLGNGLPILCAYNGNPDTLQMVVGKALLEFDNSVGKVVSHGFRLGTSGSFQELAQYFQFDKAGLLQILKKQFPNLDI